MKRLGLTLLLCISTYAYSAEIYQIVDEKGRKTFTNIVPPTEHNLEKVELGEPNLSHDSNYHDDNDRYYEELAAEEQQHREIGQRLNQAEAAARARLEESEAALLEARELRAGDYFNIPGKGLRYTEAYHQRIREAEMRRDSAREDYERVRNRRPAPAMQEQALEQDDLTNDHDPYLPR